MSFDIHNDLERLQEKMGIDGKQFIEFNTGLNFELRL
jgi:hypothetical protein